MIDLPAHHIAQLPKGELARLLTGAEIAIGHARFTKRFRHLGKMFLLRIRLRCHAEIRQAVAIVIERVFRLLHIFALQRMGIASRH